MKYKEATQLSIDFKATRKNVSQAFKKYKKLLRLQPVRVMPNITQAFDFIPPSTDRLMNGIETAVHKNIEREKLLKEREVYLELIHDAIKHLSDDEKYIIVKSFVSEDCESDYSIYSDLGLGRTKYYRLKNEAILHIAFSLGIEAYYSEAGPGEEVI